MAKKRAIQLSITTVIIAVVSLLLPQGQGEVLARLLLS